MKTDKKMVALFLTPAVLSFVIMFLYPVVRTVLMSLYSVESVTSDMSVWKFNGIENYSKLLHDKQFLVSMSNIGYIWVIGGIVVLSMALLIAVLLQSLKPKAKKFYRAIVYLPNIISAVALAAMWMQYVFSNQSYGFANSLLEFLGLENVKWLAGDMKYWTMLIAFCYGAIGYYMLIFLSGIEQISQDIVEAATIDGAGKVAVFFRITLPLLKPQLKTNITFWSINTISFFVWSKMFSPVTTELSTITPMVYMYDLAFGTTGFAERNAGAAAAIGVMMSLCVLAAFFLVNRAVKSEPIEY